MITDMEKILIILEDNIKQRKIHLTYSLFY